MSLTSVSEIGLSPLPNKTYFSCNREWREEFIYFLHVDRFHDDSPRSPVKKGGRSAGVQTPDDFYGGKIKGITDHLDYIAGLGCTAIWFSPIFENNPHAYHGYNINNYLNIDPHFGTKDDLIELVEAAHRQNPPIRIILDVVINHSGDHWSYPGGYRYYYCNDQHADAMESIQLLIGSIFMANDGWPPATSRDQDRREVKKNRGAKLV
jgi:1,4-alpha-glucan branching enzyme